jgi:hypothetical protein
MYRALRLLMQDLGEPYEWQEHDSQTPKFADVFRTTWDELAERGLVRPSSFDRYFLTGEGWIVGLKLTGRFEELELKERAGRLENALKSRVKETDRKQWGGADRSEIARETGLSEHFIYDAIDSHLLRELFGIVDANWAVSDEMKNSIDIPPRFGLKMLAGS